MVHSAVALLLTSKWLSTRERTDKHKNGEKGGGGRAIVVWDDNKEEEEEEEEGVFLRAFNQGTSACVTALARQRQRDSQPGGFSAVTCVGGTLIVAGATISATAAAAAALVVVALVLTQRHHHVTKTMPSWANHVAVAVAAVVVAAPAVVDQGGGFEQI